MAVSGRSGSSKRGEGRRRRKTEDGRRKTEAETEHHWSAPNRPPSRLALKLGPELLQNKQSTTVPYLVLNCICRTRRLKGAAWQDRLSRRSIGIRHYCKSVRCARAAGGTKQDTRLIRATTTATGSSSPLPSSWSDPRPRPGERKGICDEHEVHTSTDPHGSPPPLPLDAPPNHT